MIKLQLQICGSGEMTCQVTVDLRQADMRIIYCQVNKDLSDLSAGSILQMDARPLMTGCSCSLVSLLLDTLLYI